MLMLRATRGLFSKIIDQETLIFPRTIDTIKKENPVNDLLNHNDETKLEATGQASQETVNDSATDLVDDWAASGEVWREKKQMPEEKGFTYKGNEPTMFGDWQHKGRTTDFE